MMKTMKNMKTLVIVPCGKAKIWDRKSSLDYVSAEDAYIGTFFSLNKEYARTFGDRWIILSAKYGFINPETLIQQYDVSFNNTRSNPVSTDILKEQIHQLELAGFERIIGLGGVQYRNRISESFGEYHIEILFPFANCLGIGEMQGAIKRAIEQNSTHSE